MLDSGKKFRAFRDKKIKYSNHTPPFKLNGRSLIYVLFLFSYGGVFDCLFLFCLSSSRVLCTPCCQFLWIVDS